MSDRAIFHYRFKTRGEARDRQWREANADKARFKEVFTKVGKDDSGNPTINLKGANGEKIRYKVLDLRKYGG